MLKAPHSFRQINDVLIIVAVSGAPLGSANVRVGCICVCVCVRLCCRYTSNGKAGEWLDWSYRGEINSVIFKKKHIFLESKSVGYRRWIFECSFVQPFTLRFPFSRRIFHHSGQQAKNKDPKQSTKGPPVQLVWWLRCGRSSVLPCPGCEDWKCQIAHWIKAGYN